VVLTDALGGSMQRTCTRPNALGVGGGGPIREKRFWAFKPAFKPSCDVIEGRPSRTCARNQSTVAVG